ncbi:MAG: M15 family metallopeptidase [Gemmatimonadaceae bacterium]
MPAQTDTTAHATFHIVPRRSVEALRAEALTLAPPVALQGRQSADLVELVTLDSTIRLDVRYASTNNFMGAAMYSQARAFLQRPAAEALVRAHRALAREGYGLLIHDAYRPWYVTWMFWEATPDSQRTFVANPATGSRHNRGAAVDLTLYDRKTGRAVRMPSGYDEFTARAYANYAGGTDAERARRALLRRYMEAEGFTVNPTEWWHFDYNGWRQYPVLNVPFERVR